MVKHLKEEDLQWCDILHYSRNYSVAPEFLDEQRKKFGFKIIVDTDDWWEAPPQHPKYDWWIRSNISLLIRQHLMYADAVTCTTERLAQYVKPLNPKVYVIPNGIAYGEGQFAYRKQDTDELLYASSVMNYTNTALLKGVLEDVRLVIAGYSESKFFDIIIENLGVPYRTIPWKDSETYMSSYEGGVMILPSKDNEFNSLKSPLKLLEAAALKMPVIVSRAAPYTDEIFPVRYVHGAKEWKAAIRDYKENPDTFKQQGEDLFEYCQKYHLSVLGKKRLQVYEAVQRGIDYRG